MCPLLIAEPNAEVLQNKRKYHRDLSGVGEVEGEGELSRVSLLGT